MWIKSLLSRYGIKFSDFRLSWDIRPLSSSTDPFNIIEFKGSPRHNLRVVAHLSLTDPLLRFHHLRGVLKLISNPGSSWEIVTLISFILCQFKKKSKERSTVLSNWARTSGKRNRNSVRLLPIIESLDKSTQDVLLERTLKDMKTSGRLSAKFNFHLFNLVESSLDKKSYRIISYILTEQQENIPEILRIFNISKSRYYEWRKRNSMIIARYIIPNIWAMGLVRINLLIRGGSDPSPLLIDPYWENNISFSDQGYTMGSIWFPLSQLEYFINWSKNLENDFTIELPFGNWTTLDLGQICSIPLAPIDLRYGADQVIDTPTTKEVVLSLEMHTKNTNKMHNLTSFSRKEKRLLIKKIEDKEMTFHIWVFAPPRSLRATLFNYYFDSQFNLASDICPEYFKNLVENDNNLVQIKKGKWALKVISYGIRVYRGQIKPLMILRLYDHHPVPSPFYSPNLIRIGQQNFRSGQTFRFDGSSYDAGNWKGYQITLTRLRQILDSLIKFK